MKDAKRYFKVKDRVEEIKVSVGYELGGPNYFSGGTSRRGYYVYVQPVTRADGMESFVLFEGFKRLLKEVTKQSKKAEEASRLAVEDGYIARQFAQQLATEKGWELDLEEFEL